MTAGAKQAFTITANSGNSISTTVGGTCPAGSFTGGTYTTGAITADCTVIFYASSTAVNGACGSANGVAVASAPTIGLCSAGTASSVSGSNPFIWNCNGSNGGTNTSCFAPKTSLTTYSVTLSGTNVSISPSTTQTVTAGSKQSLIVTANTGYTLSTSTAGTCPIGTWSGNTYTSGAIVTNCSIGFSASANPMNGVCGSANGTATSSAPSATTLCSAGTASAVSGSGPFAWTCVGKNGGTTVQCSSPLATTTSSSWPDTTNTDPVAGTVFTASGSTTLSKPGTYNGLSFSGLVTITASNVILKNCKTVSDNFASIVISSGLTGVVIQNCDIDGGGLANTETIGIYNEGSSQVSVLANNIHGSANCMSVNGGPVLFKDNYCHNLLAGGSPHYNGFQFNGSSSQGGTIDIEHNSIINQNIQTDAVMIDNYFGPVNGVTVNNNLLTGGSFTVYCDGSFNSNPVTNVTYSNNHIGGGLYGDSAFGGTCSPAYTGNVNDALTILQGLHQ